MNRFRPHRELLVDSELEARDFDTLDELLLIPNVAVHARDKSFHRFSLSGEHLMSEYDGGKRWWVVGTVQRPELLDLPRWEPVEEKPWRWVDGTK